MRFVLPAGSIATFDTLRSEYQNQRKIDLQHPPTIGLPVFFGGTNVVARSSQITFLEQILAILKPKLLTEAQITTPQQYEESITAARVFLAACNFVETQIPRPKNNSALFTLLQKKLGINTENYLDKDDLEICFQAADRVVQGTNLDKANAAVRVAGLKPITERSWNEFGNYLAQSCKNITTINPYINYPITSITQPLFGAAFAWTGASLGILGGRLVADSSSAVAPKYKLTAMVGSTLLVMGQAGPTGVALFAPVIAGKLINTFCCVTLAQVLGTSMGLLGQGVGMGIGLPLDLAYRLTWSVCSTIGNHYSTPTTQKITGIRIADGMSVIGGIVFQVTPEEQLPKGYHNNSIEIKDDGTLYVNGLLTAAPDTGVQLAPEVVAELKAHQLKTQSDEPAVQSSELAL